MSDGELVPCDLLTHIQWNPKQAAKDIYRFWSIVGVKCYNTVDRLKKKPQHGNRRNRFKPYKGITSTLTMEPIFL